MALLDATIRFGKGLHVLFKGHGTQQSPPLSYRLLGSLRVLSASAVKTPFPPVYNQSMLTPTDKIWHNGRFIQWKDATIHVLSHVVSYGSSVFEGIRCYSTPAGPAIFRPREHIRRLLDSAKIYRIENIGFDIDQLCDAMLEMVRVNKMDS